VKEISVSSVLTLSKGLRSGDISLEEYLKHLERLFSERESIVQAFLPEVGRFRRLQQETDALMRRFPNPIERPPLFGLPIGVKDIFHVDGFETQAGSHLPSELLSGKEALSVSVLRRAGCLILGKTVTTEFAYFAPGPTRNPHNIAHTPGGSSSGSAAAVAAKLSPLTTGTQTIGSINRPAAFCGVVGYKPSYDRISRAGVIPLSPSLDHIGLFARDVTGARLAAEQLCLDWRDGLTSGLPVLGVPTGPYLDRASSDAELHFGAVCQHLEAAGFLIKSVPTMMDFEDIVQRHNLILAAEAAQVHEKWFSRYEERYHHKTVQLIEKGQKITSEELVKALKGRRRLRTTLTTLMERHEIDLWISPPAVGPAPEGLESTGDPIMNLPWTHSGLPTLSMPAGISDNGLPMGLQLTGSWYKDESLFEWALDFEDLITSATPERNRGKKVDSYT
jgi:Asp-tRNA(Asn)/Glu-tRNA(Gln) amidotransferase A subunit family amidase